MESRRVDPEFIKSDIKLTVGILVSNQIKYIRRGLEAIKPLLEAVPSELIAVDTVGEEKSDGSLKVVKEYTDKIFHFDWIDDFAAARNVAMDHAKGEWFMFFDDDEVFDDVKELIGFFKTGECEKYYSGSYFVANYRDEEHYQKDVVTRLVRRTKDTRFEGVIHEHFNRVFAPEKQFNAFVHHYGYMFLTKEQFEEKNQRNLRLLEREMETNGKSLKLYVHIVQQLMVPDPEKALKKCDEFLADPDIQTELDTPLGQWLITAKLRITVILGNYRDILECEKQINENYRLSEAARLVTDHRVAFAAFREQDIKTALDRARDYFKQYEWLKSHEDERIRQAIIDMASFLNGERLYIVTRIAAVSELAEGTAEKAYAFVTKLDPDFCEDLEDLRNLTEYTVGKLKDKEKLLDHYRRFYREEFFTDPGLFKFLPDRVRNA
jgi:glycosyltransferase involved in cell wall biosynthesis